MPSSLTSMLVNDWSVCLEYSSLIWLAPVPSSCLRDLRDHVLWEVFSETVPGLSKVSSSSAPLWTFPSRSRLHRFVFVCVSLTGCESPVSLAQGPVDSQWSWEICRPSECGVLPLGSIRALKKKKKKLLSLYLYTMLNTLPLSLRPFSELCKNKLVLEVNILMCDPCTR